jgi:hypothetical protein
MIGSWKVIQLHGGNDKELLAQNSQRRERRHTEAAIGIDD